MKKNHPILITVIVFIMLLNILMPLETIAEYNPDKSDQVLEENQPTSETTPPTEKTEDLIEKNTEALPKETATHEEVEDDPFGKHEEDLEDVIDPNEEEEQTKNQEENDEGGISDSDDSIELVDDDTEHQTNEDDHPIPDDNLDSVEGEDQNHLDDPDDSLAPDDPEKQQEQEHHEQPITEETEIIEELPPNLDEQQLIPQRGLLDAALLENVQLTIEHQILSGENPKERLTLFFVGYGAINAKLLANTYIIFQLPDEFMQYISQEDLLASYDIPALGLLGITIRKKDDFDEKDIMILDNQIVINFKSLLSLNLLSWEEYIFTLHIDLDFMPPSLNGQHRFYVQATDQIIDLRILADSKYATATINAPILEIPAAPIVDPVYSTDEYVYGSAEPNMTILLTINGEEYSNLVDESGRFAVLIDKQPPGTPITAKVRNKYGYFSQETQTIVRKIPDIPYVDPVYTHDTVVTGEAEPNLTITLIIEGINYIGHSDQNGHFAISIPNQKKGTRILAFATDENNRSSDGYYEVIVQELKLPTLAFHHVPKQLAFKSTPLVTEPTIIQRQVSDWTMEVMDTREGKTNPWKVVAHVSKPLTSVKNPDYTLPDALIFVNERQEIFILNDDVIDVYIGKTKDNPMTQISWNENEGPLLKLTPSATFAGEYSTHITWTLVDAP